MTGSESNAAVVVPRPKARSRRRRWLRVVAILFSVVVAGLLFVVLSSWRAVGARPEGARLSRMQASPQWTGESFSNRLPTLQGPIWEMTKEWLFGGSEHRIPAQPVASIGRSREDFSLGAQSPLRVTWLGHSTLLVEVARRRVLFDPVWGERVAPFTWAGPKRFFPPPLPLEQLPKLDAVVISHDHYDHLDTPTIIALAARSDCLFLVPLGVGAHLEYWGVPAARIVELDWWQEKQIGPLTLTATPARHFSGRSIAFTDKDRTLWAGWALIAPDARLFYSGDTAMFPGFEEIGQRLGPFDITLIEAGAYNAMWADVHLGPEQAVIAHRMLRGKLMVPVHWGLFDLALHGWTEPVERVLRFAKQHQVSVATPMPGQTIEAGAKEPNWKRWWPDVPWQKVEQASAYSSGVDLTAYGVP